MVYSLNHCLEKMNPDRKAPGAQPAVFVTDPQQGESVMKAAGMKYEGEISLDRAGFCKLETQPDCLAGSLCIPPMPDHKTRKKYRLLFFVNGENIVIIDNGHKAEEIIRQMSDKKVDGKESREKFLYEFLSAFLYGNLEMLEKYEKRLLQIEERIMNQQLKGFHNDIMPIRKELLRLRDYYEEMTDMGRQLENDENHFFAPKRLKYFGIIGDRAQRLANRTGYLMEYALQVRDACQAQLDARQNRNMQYLTVVSAIFFPLTLITGWYGMNFKNMPELDGGYPFIIALSVVVVAVCVIVFKKKKMF